MLLSVHSVQDHITRAVARPHQDHIIQAMHGHLNVKRQHSQATARRDTQGHSDLVTLLSDKDTGLGDGIFAEPASEQTTGKAL